MIVRIFLLLTILAFELNSTAKELVYIDKAGVIRWEKDKSEVALFGANYCLPSACDYRAAGYVNGDRKQMIKEDLDHFKRMGWDALRLCFWGDYQNTDVDGNLIENDHLDLFNFLIAEAAKRNIYMLLSPIVTYDSQWPDTMSDTTNTGFAKYYPKSSLYNDEKAIHVQENYWKQLLNYRNPYTDRNIKDEPKILFVELINEPTQHPEDKVGMVNYVNRLQEAIRSTGCKKLTFYNVSQNFGVTPVIEDSKIDGSTYAWYPCALNSNRSYEGNGLLMVDRYEAMLDPRLSKKPKIVYEFDSSDMTCGYMIPAMVREFRQGGIQFATLFSYDMLRTASMNLGWQSHYVNLVYTPSKAVSSMIAAEILRQIPRSKNYGYYPEDNVFGDFRVSYDEDLSELNDGEKFYYSNTTQTHPKEKNNLKHIAGVGSSPIVKYTGTGVYFLDKEGDDKWILDVYPDIMKLDDPFKMVSPYKVVRKAVYRERMMEINLPGLVTSISVTPGKYIIENNKVVRKDELPQKDFFQEKLNNMAVVDHTIAELDAGNEINFECEVFSDVVPESVTLFVMQKPWGYKKVEMNNQSGFTYQAKIGAGELEAGYYDYYYAVISKDETRLFPEGRLNFPERWDFYKQASYKLTVNHEKSPLSLLGPEDDYKLIRYTRTFLSPEVSFNPIVTEGSLQAYRLTVKDLESNKDFWYPCDATLSQFIGDKISLRNVEKNKAKYIHIKAYGLNGTNKAICNIVDKNGNGFGAVFQLEDNVNEIVIPVADLKPQKAVMLPQDWPGVNSYWYPNSIHSEPKNIDWDSVKFIQISLRDELYGKDELKNKGVIVENIYLTFD